jgi:adiponectin receptor
MIEKIDKMDWLEVVDINPISDIDSYMNYVSKWPLFVHMASAAICLGLSAIYHLFFVYSMDAYSLLAKLDYAGITILIFGSTVPSIQYLYACNDVACNIFSV